MKSKNKIIWQSRSGSKQSFFGKIMNCVCSGEQLEAVDEMVPSSESRATRDYYSVGAHSSRPGDVEKQQPDNGNIEEAEWSLRETSSLNYEVGYSSFSLLKLIRLSGDLLPSPPLRDELFPFIIIHDILYRNIIVF